MKRNSYVKSTKPRLYIGATPIGNLLEINPRLIQTINEVELILCEDTRVSAKLLNHLNIKNKILVSYHQHNEFEKKEHIINEIKKYTKCLLLSDAGYPLLSDPGSFLVQEALANDIDVVVINGSNALLPALISSGFNTQPFTFIGFLPSKSTQAITTLEQFKDYNHTLVLYESIHRLTKTLKIINDILGDVNISISRELTKLNEEHIYGRVSEIMNAQLQLKGELVIVIDNSITKESFSIDEEEITNQINDLMQEGISRKNAIKMVAKKLGLDKNYVYKVAHK